MESSSDSSIFDDFCNEIDAGSFTHTNISMHGAVGYVDVLQHSSGELVLVKTTKDKRNVNDSNSLVALKPSENTEIQELAKLYKKYTSDFLVHYESQGKGSPIYLPMSPLQSILSAIKSSRKLTMDSGAPDKTLVLQTIGDVEEEVDEISHTSIYRISTVEELYQTLQAYSGIINSALESFKFIHDDFLETVPLKKRNHIHGGLSYKMNRIFLGDYFPTTTAEKGYVGRMITHNTATIPLFRKSFHRLINALYKCAGPDYTSMDIFPPLLRKGMGAAPNAAYIWSSNYHEVTIAQLYESNTQNVHPVHRNLIYGIKLCGSSINIKGMSDISTKPSQVAKKLPNQFDSLEPIKECILDLTDAGYKNSWIDNQDYYNDIMTLEQVPLQTVQEFIPSVTIVHLMSSSVGSRKSNPYIDKNFAKLTQSEGHSTFIQIMSLIKTLDESKIIHQDLHASNILVYPKRYTVSAKAIGLPAYDAYKDLGKADYFSYTINDQEYVVPESNVNGFPVIIDFDRATVYDDKGRLSIFGPHHVQTYLTTMKTEKKYKYKWVEGFNMMFFASKMIDYMMKLLYGTYATIGHSNEIEAVAAYENKIFGAEENRKLGDLNRKLPASILREAIATDNVTVQYFRENIVQFRKDDPSKQYDDFLWAFLVDCINILFMYPFTKTKFSKYSNRNPENHEEFYRKYINAHKSESPFIKRDSMFVSPELEYTNIAIQKLEKTQGKKIWDMVNEYLTSLKISKPNAKGNIVYMV